jgi:hypothetical protein
MKHEKLRPSQIRIMGRNFVVLFEDDNLLGTDALGMCNPQKCIIVVKDGQHPVEEADTLLHEIFHAVWYCMNISHGGTDEEGVVHRLASGMMQVMMDNPHLLKYFQSIQNPPHLEL